MREGIFFCLVGPAGGGKTTFTELLTDGRDTLLRRAVTVTSRPARPNEKEGVDYYFVSRGEFRNRIDEKQFFEWEENHGNLYGTLKNTLTDAVEGGYDLVLPIDVRGALTCKRHFPKNTVIVFLVPPSGEELRKRLEARGTSEEEIQLRLDTTLNEYKILEESLSEIDYFVINENREESLTNISSIIKAERVKLFRLKSEVREKICKVPL